MTPDLLADAGFQIVAAAFFGGLVLGILCTILPGSSK